MLRKSLNFNIYRFGSHLFAINSRFSSQEVKSLENINEIKDVVKSEEQQSEPENSDISDESKTSSVTKVEKFEIEKLVKKPLDYDSIWEYFSSDAPKDKPYNRVTAQPRGRFGLPTDVYVSLHHKFDFSVAGFKRRLKFYIDLREEFNQRYIAQRHGILGLYYMNFSLN